MLENHMMFDQDALHLKASSCEPCDENAFTDDSI